jgi:rhomboid protease GluP
VLAIAAIALIAGFAYRAMTPQERARVLDHALAAARRLREYGRPEHEALQQALRLRTPRVLVVPALAALHFVVYLSMAYGPGSTRESTTLVAWGANLGIRTTNGEWWRLVTAALLHTGFIALVVNAATLIQLGRIVERVVGPFAVVTAYLSAALIAGAMQLRNDPLATNISSSAGVIGVFGLFLAALGAGWWRRSDCSVPVAALARLAPVSVVFILFNLVDPALSGSAEAAAGAAGFFFGAAISTNRAAGLEPWRQAAAGLAAAVLLAAVSVVPLRGLVDVRPEVQRLIDLEDRTATAYTEALERSRQKGTEVEQLAKLIEEAIVPELREADARLQALHGVPPQDRWRVDDGRKYLRLRSESWRLRAEGLRLTRDGSRQPSAAAARQSFAVQASERHRVSTRTLGKAEATERSALQLLDRIRS